MDFKPQFESPKHPSILQSKQCCPLPERAFTSDKFVSLAGPNWSNSPNCFARSYLRLIGLCQANPDKFPSEDVFRRAVSAEMMMTIPCEHESAEAGEEQSVAFRVRSSCSPLPVPLCHFDYLLKPVTVFSIFCIFTPS